jgi:signal peptidase I
VTADEKSKREHHPWRDNIEAVTVAIIVAVFLKYFVVEAYKIPTGSMQPTLMGWDDGDGGGIFDRILVDKLSFHFRDPERFEVAVFRYPLDSSKNFVKRIWGLPGEQLRIDRGDVWRRDSSSDPWEVLRRPRPVQRETWRGLELDGQWDLKPGPDSWELDGDDLSTSVPAEARFPAGSRGVRNNYTDGYAPSLRETIGRESKAGGDRTVGDLRLETTVVADETCSAVLLRLSEGSVSYNFRFPGPASPDQPPGILVEDSSGQLQTANVRGESDWHLPAGRPVDLAVQNLDDLLELEIDGEVWISVEVPSAHDQRSDVSLRCLGGGVAFRNVSVFRDIYYTSARMKHEWDIPADSYVMLGDNTLDSSDSREWRRTGFRVDAPGYQGQEIHGNLRSDENPRTIRGEDGQSLVFFEDVFGERHVFGLRESVRLTAENASFVGRHMITGRALAVFWPMKPSLGIYRLGWIR